jgi:hypothetical protein
VTATPSSLCADPAPYLLVACYALAYTSHAPDADGAAVLALRPDPGNAGELVLARVSDVGTVWGLAHAPGAGAAFAAAFQKRGQLFGPEGPGAIYRVELATGARHGLFAEVPASGDNLHEARNLSGAWTDEPARNAAGKNSLGDLELSEDGTTLFVVNLADRRIYRYDVATAQLLGSFAHGAAAEPWAADARPFALAFHEGRLYHGLVNSAESSQRRADLAAYVYSSAPDGTDMRQVAALPLTYPRGVARVAGVIQGAPLEEVSIDWQPWKNGYSALRKLALAVYPQPILADIEFDNAGNMLLGLRDRQVDMTLGYQWRQGDDIEKPGLGVGDLILAHRQGEAWAPVLPDGSEPYRDRTSLADSGVLGGLAWPLGGDELAAAMLLWGDAVAGPAKSVTWFRAPEGRKAQRQDEACNLFGQQPTAVPFAQRLVLPRVAEAHSEWWPVADLGDVEDGRCNVPPTPTPTPTDTPTPTPTPTSTATTTPTVTPSATPSPTPTPTPTPAPVYLPTLLGESCTPEQQHGDVVLVIDASTTMLELTSAGRTKIDAARDAARQFVALLDPGQDQAAVVWFNAGAAVEQGLTDDPALLSAALDRIRVQLYTRIHLGLDAAAVALAGPNRRAGNAAVVIVLTDGRSMPEPAQMAVDASARLKARGVTVFTIGLGNDLDLWALERMATTPDHFRRAYDAEELVGIYHRIARELPCPPSAFFPYPPAPTAAPGQGARRGP